MNKDNTQELSDYFELINGRKPDDDELEFLKKSAAMNQKENSDAPVENPEGKPDVEESDNQENQAEIDRLQKKLDKYEKDIEHVDLLNRLTPTREHWILILKFIKNSGITFAILALFFVILPTSLLEALPMFRFWALLVILGFTYLYPLLSRRERFEWDAKLEKRLTEMQLDGAHVRSMFKNVANEMAERMPRQPDIPRREETQAPEREAAAPYQENEVQDTLENSETKETTPQPRQKVGFGAAEMFAIIAGGLALASVYAFNFIQVNIPILGNYATTLSDVLNAPGDFVNKFGLSSYIDTIDFTVSIAILTVCPIVFILFAILPSRVAKVIAALSAFVEAAFLGTIAVKITNAISESEVAQKITEQASNYFGPGFWILIGAVIVMVLTSIGLITKSLRK